MKINLAANEVLANIAEHVAPDDGSKLAIDVKIPADADTFR